MRIGWASQAKDDYAYWQKTNKKLAEKIDILISNIIKTPFEGLGKPEPLKANRSGFWSRRINHEHKLIYKVKNNILIITQCRYHY